MAIKSLRRGLPTVGFAKIGEAGKPASNGGRKAPPTKFDHIELTTRSRNQFGQLELDLATTLLLLSRPATKTCGGCDRSRLLAKQYGEPRLAGGLPVNMGILLPSDDLEISFPNKVAWYRGHTEFCRGDHETAERRQVVGTEKVGDRQIEVLGDFREHPGCSRECPDFKARLCKPNARLRFVLGVQQSLGGCYEFRTTSWNSIANIQNALNDLQQFTCGVLRWVPLVFEIHPQTVTFEGKSSTQHIAQVIYRGSPGALIAAVQKHLELTAPAMHRILQLEAQIMRANEMDPEDIREFREEFDHESLEAESPARLAIPEMSRSVEESTISAASAAEVEPEAEVESEALASLFADEPVDDIPDAEIVSDAPEVTAAEIQDPAHEDAPEESPAPQLSLADLDAAIKARLDRELKRDHRLPPTRFSNKLRAGIAAVMSGYPSDKSDSETIARAIEYAETLEVTVA